MGKNVRNYPMAWENGRIYPAIIREHPPLALEAPPLDEDGPEVVAWMAGGEVPAPWREWMGQLDAQGRGRVLATLKAWRGRRG